MKTTKLLICAISVTAVIAGARADAQNLSATLVGITPGLAVSGTVDNGSFIQDYPSGVMHFTTFDAFCVDPTQDLSYGETLVYQVQDVNLLVRSHKVARLVGGFLASSQSDQDAAAVQWAIWEATTETSPNLSLLDGKVRITTPVSLATAELANQYLANVQNFAPATLTYLTDSCRQDVVTWNVVPEPGSLGLTVLSGLVLLRRRR